MANTLQNPLSCAGSIKPQNLQARSLRILTVNPTLALCQRILYHLKCIISSSECLFYVYRANNLRELCNMYVIFSKYICSIIHISFLRFRLMCDMWAQSPNDRLLIFEIKEKLRDILITPQTVWILFLYKFLVLSLFLPLKKYLLRNASKVSITGRRWGRGFCISLNLSKACVFKKELWIMLDMLLPLLKLFKCCLTLFGLFIDVGKGGSGSTTLHWRVRTERPFSPLHSEVLVP